MGKMNLNVQIESGTGLSGVYPFIVVCFDNDLSNELYKTAATNNSQIATWNESFPIDLTTHIKNLKADDKPEPTYLTFFLFDTGVPGAPALGSAGVLLSTVRDNGVAKGEFPIVNGTGALSITVEQDKKGWIHSDAAKIAGVAGAVGVAGLAAGLTAMAFNKNKKKKNQTPEEAEAEAAAEAAGGKKKKKFSIPGMRALTGGGNDDDDDESADDAQAEEEEDDDDDDDDGSGAQPAQPAAAAGKRGGAQAAGNNARPWWDPETSEDEDEEDDAHPPPTAPATPAQ